MSFLTKVYGIWVVSKPREKRVGKNFLMSGWLNRKQSHVDRHLFAGKRNSSKQSKKKQLETCFDRGVGGWVEDLCRDGGGERKYKFRCDGRRESGGDKGSSKPDTSHEMVESGGGGESKASGVDYFRYCQQRD